MSIFLGICKLQLYKFFVGLLVSLFFCNSGYALIPDVWSVSLVHGNAVFLIQNSSLGINLTCNSGGLIQSGTMETQDHYLEVSVNGHPLHISAGDSLDFLIDGIQIAPTFSRDPPFVDTATLNSANDWNKFIQLLSHGKTIEVFYNNQSAGIIKPRGNLDYVAEELLMFCTPVFYMDD